MDSVIGRIQKLPKQGTSTTSVATKPCDPIRALMAINDGRRCPASSGDGAESATSIEDLPADILALMIRRLDGASLAALGCACAAFRDVAADPDPWRALCLELWPSLRDVPPRCDADTAAKAHHYRRLFADAFPFPAVPMAAALSQPTPPSGAGAGPLCGGGPQLPAFLVSAVDLRQGGACVMSRAVETDASSAWFLCAPFRVDALAQEGFTSPAPPPIDPADLELSWVLVDPDSGRAVNASSRRPVSVDRRWLTGETVVRFALVLGGVVLDAAVTCDERYGHVREVSLCMEDAEGGCVSGRDGLAVVAAAMAGGRRGRGAEEEAKVRYQEFVKGKADRKERKARREGIIDLCCSGVGAAALLGFLVMLTFR